MINLSTRSEQREKCKNMRRKREGTEENTNNTNFHKQTEGFLLAQNLENIWKFVTRGAEWPDYYLICFLLSCANTQQHCQLNISHNHTLTTLNRADASQHWSEPGQGTNHQLSMHDCVTTGIPVRFPQRCYRTDK